MATGANLILKSRQVLSPFSFSGKRLQTSSLLASGSQEPSPLGYCINLVKQRDPEGYLLTLLLPRGSRESMFAVRALNVELGLIRERIHRHSGTAEVFRLQFWRDTVRRLYGSADGPLAKQPVAEALQLYSCPRVSEEHLLSLVEARQESLKDEPFPDVEALESAVLRSHGSLLFSTLQSIDPALLAAPDVRRVAEEAGRGVGLTLALRSVPPLAASGVVLLPLAQMEKNEVGVNSVLRGESSEELKALARELSEAAAEHLNSARVLHKSVPREARVALLGTVIAADFLNKLAKCGYDLFDGRLQLRAPLLPWRLLLFRCLARY